MIRYSGKFLGLCGLQPRKGFFRSETDQANAFFGSSVEKGDTPVDFIAEGHESTLCRWWEVIVDSRVLGMIAETVSDGPRATPNHRSTAHMGSALPGRVPSNCSGRTGLRFHLADALSRVRFATFF